MIGVSVKDKVIFFIKKLLGTLPGRNPIGRAQFDAWANDLISTYGLPNSPGYRAALCGEILQNKGLYTSKFRYAQRIRKAQVNETAYLLMREINDEKKQVLAAATATPAGATSEPVQNDEVQTTQS